LVMTHSDEIIWMAFVLCPN